jgi:hypothetical protein
MDVTAALYSHGTLLLAESSGADAKATKLLLAARNYTLPPPSVNVNTASQSIWLREVVSDLSQLVPGEAGVQNYHTDSDDVAYLLQLKDVWMLQQLDVCSGCNACIVYLCLKCAAARAGTCLLVQLMEEVLLGLGVTLHAE